MYNFLNGFDGRMKLISVVQAVINRKGKNTELESRFTENQMENLIIMVLVYLMDKKLRYNEESTLESLAGFLKNVLVDFSILGIDFYELASYIVKDVLQNRGERRSFMIYDMNKGFTEYTFTLVADRPNERNKLMYQLTDEAYDFLFRTKEIDGEIDFSVERFKLKEFIKRHNYTKALEQSEELIKKIREQKARIQLFILRCRENISKVTIEEYETVTRNTHNLLNEEYEELELIRKQVREAGAKIETALEKGDRDERTKQSAGEITSILNNLEITIDEQKRLINQSYTVEEFYREKIEDSFYQQEYKRFSFEDIILKPIEKMEIKNISELKELLTPIFRPVTKKHLNLNTFYERQQKLREVEAAGEMETEKLEDRRDIKAQTRNEQFVAIIDSLLTFLMTSEKKTSVSEFIESLSQEELYSFMEGNSLLNVILNLYAIGKIDLGYWRINRIDNILTPYGEFDLSYCLDKAQSYWENLDEIVLYKDEEKIYRIELVTYENTDNVEINDFIIEVKRNGQ